jgi:long-chain acyl-CoA synthetase
MILAELDAVYKNFRNELAEDDEILSFLPQSHIFGKLEYLFGLRFGWVQNYAQSLDTLISDIAEVRPTFMLAVPRVYEKFYAKLLSHREALAPTKRKLFDWALGIGIQVVQHQERHEAVPIFLKAQKKIADKIIFDKVRVQRFGGRLKFFISGGAPLSVDIARFFAASSLTILEGYGLTETSAAACVNPPHFNKPGTVGRPLPGVEVKIAPEDGEILMRGDIVTPGYYRNEAATKDAFRDGWFCSGDIGEIDADGFVKITDRKKDLIITAGGKNVAPQKIENKIKENPLVSSVLVYGDRKKYLVALITLNPDNARDYLKNHGSPDATGELHQQPAIRQNLDQWIEQVNSQLGNYETIKKFTILGQDFSVETGELTASLKVKRKVCNAKFHDILEGMYA